MKLKKVKVGWGGKIYYLIIDESSKLYYKKGQWVKNVFKAERFSIKIAIEKIE